MSRNLNLSFLGQNKSKSTKWVSSFFLNLPYIHRKLIQTLTLCWLQVVRVCFSFLWTCWRLNIEIIFLDPVSGGSWLCPHTRHRASRFSNHWAKIISMLWDSHGGSVLQSFLMVLLSPSVWEWQHRKGKGERASFTEWVT